MRSSRSEVGSPVVGPYGQSLAQFLWLQPQDVKHLGVFLLTFHPGWDASPSRSSTTSTVLQEPIFYTRGAWQCSFWFKAQSLPKCCSLRKETLPLILSLSIQVYKAATSDILLRVSLRQTRIPSGEVEGVGEKQYSQLLHATETGLSSSRVGLVGSCATFPHLLFITYLVTEKETVQSRAFLSEETLEAHVTSNYRPYDLAIESSMCNHFTIAFSGSVY